MNFFTVLHGHRVYARGTEKHASQGYDALLKLCV